VNKRGFCIPLLIIIIASLSVWSTFLFYVFSRQLSSNKQNSYLSIEQSSSTITKPVNKDTVSKKVASTTVAPYIAGEGFNFNKYQLQVQPGWSIEHKQHFSNNETQDLLILTYNANNEYTLIIEQKDNPTKKCVYTYEEKNRNDGSVMYLGYITLVTKDKIQLMRSIPEVKGMSYEICEGNFQTGIFSRPSPEFGFIGYQTPESVSKEILGQMDSMVSSLQVVK
jgi:hypothetical protein